MENYLDTVFGPEGLLAARFPGYAPRSGQVALANNVDQAIRDSKHLLAEAPTGVGKSLAYSVPATYHAKHGKGRVLIVTANIALQEQLVKKDLPSLAEILPWKFKFALLKGIGNYLCLSEMATSQKKGLIHSEGAKALEAWAAVTQLGDKSELSFEPRSEDWMRFSTTSDDCDGQKCKFFDQCHAINAKRHANEADVIVTNYKLLFLHFKIYEATGLHLVIPEFGTAILDEGHKAVDIARDTFGFEISSGAIKWLAKKLASDAMVNELAGVRDQFFDDLSAYRRSTKYKARLKQKHPVKSARLTEMLGRMADAYGSAANALEARDREDPEIDKLRRRASRTEEIIGQVNAAMELDGDDVYFIDEDEQKVKLCSKPVSVAERLKLHIFSEDKLAMVKSTTVTSATLTTNDSFAFAVKDFGVEKPRLLVADSPFRWGDQVLLVTPEDGIPDDPNDPNFTRIAAEKCAQVITQARGRTLALFTSWKGLNAAYEQALKTGHRILKQGDMPRLQLIDEFKRDTHSVLLGVESFWAGVDVPGEALSCVFIDKLPFPHKEDPIADAMTERDREWFTNFSLPRAIIAFKQGFGRLIRTTSDRGVVVVLDPRITKKGYGWKFVSSLPKVRRSKKIEDISLFLDGALPPPPPPMKEGRSWIA